MGERREVARRWYWRHTETTRVKTEVRRIEMLPKSVMLVRVKDDCVEVQSILLWQGEYVRGRKRDE